MERAEHYSIWQRCSRLLDIYTAEEEVAAGFRAKQLSAVIHLIPFNLFANCFNVIVVLHALRSETQAPTPYLWAVAVLATVLNGARVWFKGRDRPAPPRVSRDSLQWATYHAFALGLLWGLAPVLFYSRAAAGSALVIATIVTGMIGAGGFALVTIPRAALAYIAALCGGCYLGFMLDGVAGNADLLLLLTVYVGVVSASVISSSRTFGARLMAEAESEHQKQVVGLLLHDFESSASDWLWETDERGYLKHASVRLTEVWGLPADELHARDFISLIKTDSALLEAADAQSQAVLEQHLGAAVPFRDLAVAVVARGHKRWWSLTAKPLLDSGGRPRGWRGVCADITERKCAALEMTALANCDALTGLANRHAFQRHLSAALSGQPNCAEGVALLFIDLDRFKDVNDSLGHVAGDELLRRTAERLHTRTRTGDMLARLGGDEFALVCSGQYTEQSASELAVRLLEALSAPCSVGGTQVRVAGSIGVAIAPLHANDPDTLIRQADLALYAAKAAGRSAWKMFSADMDERARRRLNTFRDLRQALQNGEMELHYQPQIELDTGKTAGLEALLRWRHGEQGLIPPAVFIPIAEESGIIDRLGAWALMRACGDAASWPGKPRVAVNISALQFVRTDILREVRRALAQSGLEPARLELEITESLLINDSAHAQRILSAIREMGVRIALDDFGTGYSSLAYLRAYPLTQLKIDRAFIAGIGSDASAAAIVRTITDLAATLGLETTAEGIETELERRTLVALGRCTYGQGFRFSPPLSAAQLHKYLRRRSAEHCMRHEPQEAHKIVQGS